MELTRETPIGYILRLYPETIAVFKAHGLGCATCMASLEESLESCARLHGLVVETLLADLQRAIGQERRPTV